MSVQRNQHRRVLLAEKFLLITGTLLLGFAVLLIFAAGTARAHDVYRDFYSGGAPGLGRWCCSGNLEGTSGDCSPAEYKVLRDGTAVMWPKMYPGKAIMVPAHRILWMSVPGGEMFEAHYCGKPKVPGVTYNLEDDPDPEFTTICAAIRPGGV
jgi:hypothetical protein